MRKVERLFNLIALLLETARPLTIDEIRRAIPGYAEPSDEAFRRMFERDKRELRELGIPIERAATDVWDSNEEGYLIPKTEAVLPDPGLTADEHAALALAAQAWEGDLAGGSAAMGLLKLSLAGGAAEGAGRSWLLPRIEPADARLEPLFDAVTRRKRVTFRYRSSSASAPEERTVDPYQLFYRGTWYVAGLDRGRGEVRHFKVARIEGAVAVSGGPGADFETPEGTVEPLRAPWEGEPEAEARVAFSPDAAWWAERRTGARRIAERPAGWIEIALPVADASTFVSWVLGFGDDAVVLDPPEIRARLLERLGAWL